MLIPKSRMPMLIKALDLVIGAAEDKYDPPIDFELDEEELEIIRKYFLNRKF